MLSRIEKLVEAVCDVINDDNDGMSANERAAEVIATFNGRGYDNELGEFLAWFTTDDDGQVIVDE
jgi:Ca2+-binding EF-hand superfamily protein